MWDTKIVYVAGNKATVMRVLIFKLFGFFSEFYKALGPPVFSGVWAGFQEREFHAPLCIAIYSPKLIISHSRMPKDHLKKKHVKQKK